MKSVALCGALIAVCSIGAVMASASAKSGGGGAAAAAGVRGGLRAGGPAFFHKGPAFAPGVAAKRSFRRVDLRRQLNSLPPYWPGSGDFDPFYYSVPTDAAGTISLSAYGEPIAPSQVPPTRVLVAQPGCRTQEQKVHSEAGGEQLVHITRCY
jgi:hypothetical protein